MRTIFHLIGFLLLQAPFTLAAQGQQVLLEEEHRYHFIVQSDMGPAVEKELMSAIADLDPRMRVNIDALTHVMKVLAYQPIDPGAVITIAAQLGVALQAQAVENVPGEQEEQ